MKQKTVCLLLALVFALALLPTGALAVDFNSYTPYGLAAELIDPDGTHPYGSALLTFKINNLPRSTDTDHWYVNVEKKIGNGSWSSVLELDTTQCLDEYQKSSGVFKIEALWLEDYNWDGSTPVSFRVGVTLYDYTFSAAGSSPWSETVTIGLKSSSWAAAEIEKADGYGLIPDSLSGKDLTRPVTREEFCELALLLYEKTTGTVPAPVSANPFTDTNNTQILKAFSLGITTGTSATTFSPKKLINREQCAAMLFRTIKAIAPDANYSVAGVPDFADQKYISAYAVEATKYMSKLGIIKGDQKVNFMPKAVTSTQEAAGYGMATREAAILMSVRTYEAIK